jgi:phosphate-selective porin OprO/OprP
MMKKVLFVFFALAILSQSGLKAQGCGGAASDEGLKMFGFLQSQYEYKMEDPSKNSFTFERARLGAMGKIPYDFSYYVVMELSPFIAPNPYLLDAFITYDRFKWARVSMGSFKTPIGLEINTACNGLLTVNRSVASLQMVAPFRDLGIVFMGGDDSTFMTYQIGIMNGRGLGAFDNNTKKDLMARLLFKPLPFWRIGGSYRKAYPSLNNTTDDRVTFAVETQVKYNNFTLQAEYLSDEGDYNRDLGGGCSGDLLELGEKRSGYYATLAYLTPWNLEPVFKYETFDTGNTSEEIKNAMTFGFNYYFNDWTRLQVNYIYKAEEPIEIKNDELVLQLQVKF